jgi:hypothetical protein
MNTREEAYKAMAYDDAIGLIVEINIFVEKKIFS